MSARVARRSGLSRLIGFGALLVVAGGASAAALVAATSVATHNLAVAFSHSPNVNEGWREPAAAPKQAPVRRERVASIYSEHDALFAPFETPGLGEGLAALGNKLAAGDAPASALRIASVREPVQMAAATPMPAKPVAPKAEPVKLAALEAPEQTVRTVEPAAPVVAEPVRAIPIPTPRPADFARMAQATPRERIMPVSFGTKGPEADARPATRLAALGYAAAPEAEAKSGGATEFFKSLLPSTDGLNLPGGGGVAIYDISSATVRLPNGERLEAHSGLAHRQDNPAYVREKNRGPTPPNVYDLRMREALFHGSEAIRLTPRDQKKVFNRDGLLAHPYMYVGGGDRSQSNGCVVFKDYPRFLRAFKAGQFKRLVVVPSMDQLRTVTAGL